MWLGAVVVARAGCVVVGRATAFLDPETEAELLRTLGVFARGRAVLLATHSAAAMRWADTVIDLRGATVTAELP